MRDPKIERQKHTQLKSGRKKEKKRKEKWINENIKREITFLSSLSLTDMQNRSDGIHVWIKVGVKQRQTKCEVVDYQCLTFIKDKHICKKNNLIS